MEQTMSTMNLTVSVVRSRRLPLWIEIRALLIEWHERACSRRDLRLLADQEVWDMGLSRIDAYNEANKPFWKA
jgi:uncharacterized protein YjiS (DUF1127 family)